MDGADDDGPDLDIFPPPTRITSAENGRSRQTTNLHKYDVGAPWTGVECTAFIGDQFAAKIELKIDGFRWLFDGFVASILAGSRL